MRLPPAERRPVQPAAVGAAHVRQVRVGVGLGGEGLLTAAARRQQLPLFGVPPFHPAVLEPDFDLRAEEEPDLLGAQDEVSALGRKSDYLRVFQAQFAGELLPVGFADVLLLLESSLQGFSLEVGEHGPSQHTSSRFPPGGQRP